MTREPLDLDDLQQLLWSFAAHRVLTVSGRVGILGALATKPLTPADLAQRLDLDPSAAGKLVRALNAMGVVEPDGDGFRLSVDLAAWFAPGVDDMTPFLEHSHDLYDRWGQSLEPWLRGQPWKTKRRSTDGVKRFGAAMQAMAAQIATGVVAALDTTGLRRMLDVGGGTGTYARIFCEHVEGLRAVVLDTPEVAEIGRANFASTELADRIEFVGGDYRESDYGRDYDLVLLANVLHQELPERAAELVERATAALAPGGRVSVVDFAIDENHREALVGALFAINMRSFGDTYDEPTITSWMIDAGLAEVQRNPVGTTRWVITGRKPV
ncbi:MAG: methyltransferase domain-containing protein [Deltaproteobacteria bacterium]|nr:methyltransferase domain-containing protein [Deltaproteobacteria bacterium]